MTDEPVQRLSEFGKRVKLREIMPIEIHSTAKSPADRESPWAFDIQFLPVRWTTANLEVISLFGMRIRLTQREVERCDILLDFRVHYEGLLATDTDEEIQHYLGHSGWHHVWPFLRAEVHSLSTRFGCPPLLLPTITPGTFRDVPFEKEAPAPT